MRLIRYQLWSLIGRPSIDQIFFCVCAVVYSLKVEQQEISWSIFCCCSIKTSVFQHDASSGKTGFLCQILSEFTTTQFQFDPLSVPQAYSRVHNSLLFLRSPHHSTTDLIFFCTTTTRWIATLSIFFGELKSIPCLVETANNRHESLRTIHESYSDVLVLGFLAVHSLLIILYCIMLSRARFVVISHCNVLTWIWAKLSTLESWMFITLSFTWVHLLCY